MPFSLLKYGLSNEYPVEVDLPPPKELKSHYDVVIIGAGGHGLAIAYYLAKYQGITNIAVLEKSYLDVRADCLASLTWKMVLMLLMFSMISLGFTVQSRLLLI